MPIEPQKKLPKLDTLANPRAALELINNFQRVYEYIDYVVRQLKDSIAEQIKNGQLSSDDFNSLIGIFSQPLAGSNVSDPLLQSVIQSFGSQLSNLVFASPNGSSGSPTFRTLVLADIPAGVGITNTAPANNIPRSNGTNLIAGSIEDDLSTVNLGAGILIIDITNNLILVNLPISDPGITGALWNNSGRVEVSP